MNRYTRFARGMALALDQAATALRQLADELEESAEAEVASGEPPPGIADRLSGLGSRQRDILGLPELRSESGMKTAEIGHRINYDIANAYLTLQSLRNRGLVELVPASRPQRWRMPEMERPFEK